MIDDKFSWVETHKQLVEYLSTKENFQTELIQLLKSVGIGPFNDKAGTGEQDIELEEIDPFTFFCYIYKYGAAKRLSNLQSIAEKLNLQIPLGESGIPSAQAQKVWLFPYKFNRNNNEIGRLWSFFHKAKSGQITNEDFLDVLQIRSTGKAKLTEGLFYVKPEKYLPINGPTKPYIKEELGISPNFNSFTEYIELLDKIKSASKLPLYELSYEAWKWNKERMQIDYWVFQGDSKAYDFEAALRTNSLTNWPVNTNKEKIKVGDKVVLWITGSKSGCYALAEVTSEPIRKTDLPEDKFWKEEYENALKANIRITHNLINNPILSSEISRFEELSDLKIDTHGTNSTATQEHFEKLLELIENRSTIKYWLYAPGENASEWEQFFESGIIGLGWDEIGDLKLLGNLNDITQAIQKTYNTESKSYNNALANYEFRDVMKPGDIVIAKKGRKEFLGYGIVTSDYFYDETRSSYQKCRRVNWQKKGIWETDGNPIVLKTLTDITKYPDYVRRLIQLLGIENKSMDNILNYPINTIFYGPPGTGKTFNTVLRAAEIIEGRKIESYDEALKCFRLNLHDQIEFITFHQNYSYEDFIQGLRPDTENDKQLTFERKDGVFKVIADKALNNIIASEKPAAAKKPFEVAFNEFVKPLVEGEIEEIEVKMKKVSFFITSVTNKSIEFRKTSGGTEHTLSIATLRKMYEAESVLEIQGLGSYYSPLLEQLLKTGLDSSGRKEIVDRKNYVIIIDEINRANISRVFGELITLIEPDKRSHGKIPLETKLPSGDLFMVPSNLYIIGTMNTADKSIALLDIALRRRFEFEAMYPKYEIADQEIYDVEILKKINSKIIDSKGHDFQIGHAYFMGENKDLKERMNKKVIPLLLEYYMNDEKEVKGILKYAELDIEENSWPIRIL